MIPGIGMIGMVGKVPPADGKFMIAAAYNDYLYISNDFGSSWTPIGSSSTWMHVSCSTDGKYILATNVINTQLSTNYGASWTTLAGGSSALSYQTAMSYDGRYMYRIYGSYVYRSSDYGATWSSTYCVYASGVRCSADGRTVITFNTGFNSRYILISFDYGITLDIFLNPGILETYGSIYDTDISGNGNNIIAAVYQGTSKFSNNRGTSWSDLPPFTSVNSCSINYNGSCYAYRYNKTNNSGSSYSYFGYLGPLRSAWSASGQYMIYCAATAMQLRVSNNYGATESLVGPTKTFKSVAIGKLIPA